MRKISAHYIFDGKILHKNAILLVDDDNSIIDVLKFSDTIPETEGVEFYNGIICPGFVNAHCHLELSHLLHQIPRETTLTGFISQIIAKRNVIGNIEDSISVADAYMRNNGIVAVGDISNTTDSFKQKIQSDIHYHTFIELFDLYKDTFEKYKSGKQLFNEFRTILRLSLSPHAPYSCSPKLIRLITEHAVDYEYPVTIHNQEHASENSLYVSKSGDLYDFFTNSGVNYSDIHSLKQSSLQAIVPLLPSKNHILFVHDLYTSQQDIDFLKFHRESDTFTFVLCPLSNLYIGNVLPPVDLFIKNYIPIAIGTDSLASNEQLSILSELICLQQNFPTIPLQNLLQFATHNGAVALMMQSKLGSFKVGKKPGVNLIENLDLLNLRLTEKTTCRVL